MSPRPSTYIAWTSPINPDGAKALTKEQIWAALRWKVKNPGAFTGGAIKSTKVLTEDRDASGREVITREVVFTEGDRRAVEICTLFEPMKIEFLMPDGTRVLNTLSDGDDGQLFLTYQFEWYMPEGTSAEVQQQNTQKWQAMARGAVQASIKVMREMLEDGKIDTLL